MTFAAQFSCKLPIPIWPEQGVIHDADRYFVEMAEPVRGGEGDNLILPPGGFSSSPPRPDKQDEEYDIENTERFPDPCLQISGGPMPQDDAAVGNLEQDAIGDEVTVPDRVAGYSGIHQGEDKEQGRGKLDIAVMIRLCDFRHEFLKNKIAGKEESHAQDRVIECGDPV